MAAPVACRHPFSSAKTKLAERRSGEGWDVSGSRQAPELKVLDVLDLDRPTHWSAVARQLHLRVGSAQQYLSRLARQGLARRASAGWYVLARPMRPAWRRSPELTEALAQAGSGAVGWSSSQFAALATDPLPVFMHIAVPRTALSSSARSLESAGYQVDLGRDQPIMPGPRSRVLLRASSERSGRLAQDPSLATASRAFTDLAIEVVRGEMAYPEGALASLGRALFSAQLISLSQMHRYATRRYEAAAVIEVMRAALPEEVRRSFRALLAG